MAFCLYCKSGFEGRSDKIFCSRKCKTYYYVKDHNNLCKCGCGKKPLQRFSDYVEGHNSKGTNNHFYGKVHSIKTIQKIRAIVPRNENHSKWKGDNVKYSALHAWIRRRKKKPKFCEECKLVPPLDLANISGEYKRDIGDFRWLCRSCHQIIDKGVKLDFDKILYENRVLKKSLLKIAKDLGINNHTLSRRLNIYARNLRTL